MFDPASHKPTLRLGSRGSPLALRQAEEAKAKLIAAHPELSAGDIEIRPIRTTGDRVRDRALAEIGGKGLFTKEIEEALYNGQIDVAVHCMKDLPTWLAKWSAIPAILEREDPRDAFFSPKAASIAGLPRGARVGSASLRRSSQMLALRPDLKVGLIRGNVETRLAKLAAGEFDATLLAIAGLIRLGKAERATAILEPEEMLPSAGQGAIGLQVRADDTRTRDLVAALDHRPSSIRVAAERACLDILDGSCRTPIGCLAEIEGDFLRLRALVAEPDGSRVYRVERRGALTDALALGVEAGHELRAAAGEAYFAALAEF